VNVDETSWLLSPHGILILAENGSDNLSVWIAWNEKGKKTALL
jgi:hypothetical protein